MATNIEERELSLVLRLELRLGSASSDEKLQTLLHTYLAPLILKLASDHVSVRNKVIGVCQYVSRRLKTSPDISLPVTALLKQFQQTENSFVKQFDLLYIQLGLERISTENGIKILPEVLQISIPVEDVRHDSSQGKTWSLAFHFLLRLLRSWKLPDRLSKESMSLKDSMALSSLQSSTLATWLSKFLLYEGKKSSLPPTGSATDFPQSSQMLNGLSESDEAFFSNFDETTSEIRSLAARLQLVKAKVAQFLFTPIFNDGDRFIPAVVLTSDSSSLEAFSIGDAMFKQCNLDVESETNVKNLFSLYDTVKPKIQIRILALLGKSKEATRKPEDVLRVVKTQLSSSMEGLQATKLRTGLFNLLDWTVKVGEDAALRTVGPRAQMMMKDFIEVQGWPNPAHTLGEGVALSAAQLDMRQKAYSCIGSLTSKSQPDIDLVKFLFTSLRCDPSREVHSSINEALGRAISTFDATDAEDKSKTALKTLLIQGMTASIGQEDAIDGYVTAWDTRYSTVKCANRCFAFADVDARYIDLLAIAARTANSRLDASQDLVEEGERGLDIYLYSTSLSSVSQDTGSSEITYPNFDALVERVFSGTEISATQPALSNHSMLTAAVVFCRNILVFESIKSTGRSLEVEPEWKRHIDALVSSDGEVRQLVRAHLNKTTGAVALVRAALLGMSVGIEECAEVAVELCSLVSNKALSLLGSTENSCCKKALHSTNGKVQDCAAKILGVLSSFHQLEHGVDSSFDVMWRNFSGWEVAFGQDLVERRGLLLNLCRVLTRISLRGGSEFTERQADIFSRELQKIIADSRDEAFKDTACMAVAQLSFCMPPTSCLKWETKEVLEGILQSAKKEREVAINAISRLIRHMSLKGDEDFVSEALEKLYALHEIRKPELHFAVGEGLAVAATGWHSTSTIAEFDVEAELPADSVNQALLSKILARAMEDSQKTKPSLKKAASIWLLCLVQYCGREESVKSQLRSCQAVFARLLTDRDELVQETGSRGLSLVFEMGDKSIREDLVRDLVQSFTGTNAKMSGSVSEDTQLFEEGALPTEGGASVTTYKDIVSLASEMGDPSLVYRFMNLASSNAIWTTRAAFGRFGLSNILADSNYLAENKKFYPKLFRYRFDPNPNVQRSMNEIWKALVKNPSAVVEENFDLIIEDLLKSILGKEWRVREASCSALADLVQDRDVERYEQYLDEIWGVAFKVMDDIKESVRIAALKLCRTLTNLLIRNLEVGDGMTKRASILLEHALTFLLQQFTSGSAKEVQTYAISSLLEVVKKCPPKALRPHAPALLENLVTSLSSLEHESINYLHLNADKYGMTAEKLDKMRVSGVNASPVTDCIDRCLESLDSRSSDDDPQAAQYVKDAMRRLETTFKETIGLPSKVGLSRVMVTLVVRHNVMFRPFVGRFVQLTRKSVIDRNATVSVSFAMALAYLMRLASEKQVHETSRFAKDLYFNAEQSSNRALAGEIVHAISKVSNDVFLRYGASFLPFAFIGRNDTETDVRERFDKTWKENVGGSRSINLYLSEIIELVQANIKSPSWAIKHACCLAVADVVESMEVQAQYTDGEIELIWPVLEEALSGKTWEGKSKVISAYPKFVMKARSMWREDQERGRMGQIALREAKRANVEYRPHAIEALGQFAAAREDLDLSLEIVQILKAVIQEVTADETDHMEIDAGKDAGKKASRGIVEKTVTVSVICLFQILQPHATSAVLENGKWIAEYARNSDYRSYRIALYEGAKSLIEKFFKRDKGGIGREETGDEDSSQGGVRKEFELFSVGIARDLLGHDNGPASYETESENLRKARVELGLALAESELVRAFPRGELRATLEMWLAKERSRSIQGDIQRAKGLLEAKENE